MKYIHKGFTLVELMVAIGLMVLLMGVVVTIFSSSSEVMALAEAKMGIYQNARAAFDLMARDITNMTGTPLAPNEVLNINNPNAGGLLLTFHTVTSWIDGNTQRTGAAMVQYTLIPSRTFNSQPLFSLQRTIIPADNPSNPITDVFAEFLVPPYVINMDPLPDTDNPAPTMNIPFLTEFFTHNNNETANWSINNGAANPPGDTKLPTLPPAVRITMTLTDEFMRARRTLSRVIWIPRGQ
ncbi:MAG: prepilin-type N-terminal cleavage/methylation domain-containing protein [Planctomycetes bacterium]|jgi:prepilin-type N-terminal cleavage/methylation domain-containing protein|nr:prepilin-type N-terminal cleavage/methylation domain-containing protein [Planctomycetota bacterium]HNZ85475.1 prepilin-type N-terminal cleavage/methylation domain-containing protein [Paludibacteraceae bacterium]HPY74494.1 prepilin-type N-terminal cleavage/methylation domain-containing protein [Planctomycetota bacterium]HQB00097.1 prepilin-type N-terminal cleavage/methylation domain-containing protein [Planctomycetota bacterium]